MSVRKREGTNHWLALCEEFTFEEASRTCKTDCGMSEYVKAGFVLVG